MNRVCCLLIALFLCMIGSSGLAEQRYFDLTNDSVQKKWSRGAWEWSKSGFRTEIPPGKNWTRLAELPLSPEPLRENAFRLEAEYKTSGVSHDNRKPPYFGAKVQLEIEGEKQKAYFDLPIPQGSGDWRKVSRILTVPADARAARFLIGLHGASGMFQVRNITLTPIGYPLDFSPFFNRTLKDDVSGDRRGGWTDQGPECDGRIFAHSLSLKEMDGIFLDTRHVGPAVCAMKSEYAPTGLEKMTIPVNVSNPRSLFVLHTGAWTISSAHASPVGKITVFGKHGKKLEWTVRNNVDLADWTVSAQFPNGCPMVARTEKNQAERAVFLSKYKIPEEFGSVSSVSFEPQGNGLWLILSATFFAEDRPLPNHRKFQVRADLQWLPMAHRSRPAILDGSALDLSRLEPDRSDAGRNGALEINEDGLFVFAGAPGKTVRFLSCDFSAVKADFGSREAMERYAAEIRKNGYNMVRFHFTENYLTGRRNNEMFDPEALDRFDYLISVLEKNGIFINLDLMASWMGFRPGNPWTTENSDPRKSFKYRIHFDPAVREHWRTHTIALLTHVNPYTGMRLADNPALVSLLAFNEQEYGFWLSFDPEIVKPHWIAFLREKYHNDIGAWNQKQHPDARVARFEDIPCFSLQERTYADDDVAHFLRKTESNTLEFYQKTLAEIGCKKFLAAYNCGKNLYYSSIRTRTPLVMMNAYFAHPAGSWYRPGARIDQSSCLGSGNRLFRDFMNVRQFGKPLMVTEYNIVFWNQFRYEQAFAMAAPAAFQNFSALSIYAQPISFRKENGLGPFVNQLDPIARATEFLSYFLFIRGDVRPAQSKIRIQLSEQDVFKSGGMRGALPTEASMASLFCGLTVECIPEKQKTSAPLRENEIAVRLDKTGATFVGTGYSGIVDDAAANASNLLKNLREKGFLSKKNRSDGISKFESDHGDFFLDVRRKFMRISTPRFQGVCGDAGTTVKLQEFSLHEMSEQGCAALVAIDSEGKTLLETDRMVLVYATNALNSNMVFSSNSMEILQNLGSAPVLLKRGVLNFSVRNRNAPSLKLYPLEMNGRRRSVLLPYKTDAETASFRLDTAKTGPAVFFEVAVK